MDPETERLRLAPYTPGLLLALVQEPGLFEERFGVRASDPWVFGFALVHRESRQVIGTASFKGSPDEQGAVEIAYGVVPRFEGQGYATEAAAALVAYASADARVATIRAHTIVRSNASARVLEKCGFRCVGQVEDPEEGMVWRWQRSPLPI